LYGRDTWSLPLSEEHRLRVSKSRVVRRIFGPKRDELPGELRKFHNGEFDNLYSSPTIIRQIKSRRTRCAGHVARMGEGRKLYRISLGKRRLGSPRHRLDDGIRMDVREIGCGVWSGFIWRGIGISGGLP
jgi:hypothetical protein